MSPTKWCGLVVLVLCSFLVACAGTGRNYTDSSVEETLEIEILPNTSKMFVYRLRWPQDRHTDAIHLAGTGAEREHSGGVSLTRATEKYLEENAGYVAEHMGYCREGYLKLDSSMSRFHLWIKGECKDGATQEDKQKFGTKQTLPVKNLR